MKTMKVLAICAIAMLSVASAKAQFTTGADVVSSYIWRGIPQDATIGGTPNIQPSISYTAGALTVGTWASGSFIGVTKEVDLFATYTVNPMFAITLTDYNYTFSQSYFKYSKGSDHKFEATVAYAGIESFPLGLSVNTMFAGSDTLSTGKAAFSTYAELTYPVSTNAKVFIGASVLKSSGIVYNTDGFAFTNVGCRVNKSIVLTDKFSLPVYGIVGANLSTKAYGGADKPSSLYFVAGFTL